MKRKDLFLLLLCALCACSSSSDDRSKDMTMPEISGKGIIPTPENCQAFGLGDTIRFHYIFTDDSQFTWTKGSTNGMLVIVKNSTGDDSQTLSRLSKVLVDGNELTSDKYTAREGSIILTLKESYLKGLKTGEHLLRIELSDGKVTEHKFTVYSSGGSDVKSPGTGESDKAVRLSLALMLLSVYGAGWALTRKKKRRRKVSAYSHR